VEYLLGALSGDLVASLGALAARRGVEVDAVEMRMTGFLHNPLVVLGVVGEQGRAGLERIDGTIYVSTDEDEGRVRDLWNEVLARSPLFDTLSRAVPLRIELKLGP
jgi:hypothetical protein